MGVNGAWMWMTSNRSRSNTVWIRRPSPGATVTRATDPFWMSGTETPRLRTGTPPSPWGARPASRTFEVMTMTLWPRRITSRAKWWTCS